MTARSDAFIGLSALLTGFGAVTLHGAGTGEAYLAGLDAILPAGVMEDLLSRFAELPAGPEREPAAAAILQDARLGPVARNLILLWYCGSWVQLPAAWREAYGASPLDTTRVLSAEAYQAGLQWVVAGAHPAGARQQGYGAWAIAPASEASVEGSAA